MNPIEKNNSLEQARSIPDQEDNTPIVPLDFDKVRIEYEKLDMVSLLGETMFARQTVADMLYKVQDKLSIDYPELHLFLKYAYRAPEVQEAYFNKCLEIVRTERPGLTDEQYISRAHSMFAHPDAAGHPLGAAIDLTIWNELDKEELDMGSKVAEFGDIAYTDFPNLTDEQKNNRHLLQKYMIEAGFAPSAKEWWHFSYGDKDWALYYNKPSALYRSVPLSILRDTYGNL